MGETNREVLLREGTISFAGTLFSKAFRYLFLAIVTYLIAPSEYGRFVFVLSTMFLVYGVLNPKLPAALSYYIPKLLTNNQEGQVARLIKKVTAVMIAFGVLLSLGIYVSSSQVAQLAGRPDVSTLLLFLSPLFVIYAARDILQEVFRSFERVRYNVLIRQIIYPLSRLILLCVFALIIGFGSTEALVGSEIISLILAVFIGCFLYRRIDFGGRENTREKKKKEATGTVTLRSLFSYSLPLFGSSIVGSATQQIDLILLGILGTVQAPAVFKIGATVAELSKLTASMFKQISKPLYSKIGEKNDSNLTSFYRTTSRWNALLVTPVAVYLASVPEAIVGLLFNSQYINAALVVPVLVLGFCLNIYTGNISQLLLSDGRTRSQLIKNVSMLASNVVVSSLLIPEYGILGAAIGTTTGFIVGPIVAVYFALPMLDSPPITFTHIKYAGVGIFTFLAIKIIMGLFSPIFSLIIAGLIIGLVYPTGILLTSGVHREDIEVMQAILDRIDNRYNLSIPFVLRAMKFGLRK